jgi:hypothetical protein
MKKIKNKNKGFFKKKFGHLKKLLGLNYSRKIELGVGYLKNFFVASNFQLQIKNK